MATAGRLARPKTIAGYTWRETVDHGAWAKVRRVVRLCDGCLAAEHREAAVAAAAPLPHHGDPPYGGQEPCDAVLDKDTLDVSRVNTSSYSEADRAFGREVFSALRSDSHAAANSPASTTLSQDSLPAAVGAQPGSCMCQSYAVKIFYRARLARKIRNGVEMLRAEFALVRSLSHEHVVRYILLDEDSRPHKLYLFMEYCPGGPITSLCVDVDAAMGSESSAAALDSGHARLMPAKRQRSQEDERLAERLDAIREAMRGLLEGLAYLHAAGVAHHDIKCENVLLGADGRVRICDFGVAERFSDASDGKCRVYYGTPAFQPPEVVSDTAGSSFDGCAADIWSAGVILYRLLCGGRLPFVGETVFLVMQAIATEEPILPECRADPDLCDLLSRMLSRDPSQRPTAAGALLHPAMSRRV